MCLGWLVAKKPAFWRGVTSGFILFYINLVRFTVALSDTIGFKHWKRAIWIYRYILAIEILHWIKKLNFVTYVITIKTCITALNNLLEFSMSYFNVCCVMIDIVKTTSIQARENIISLSWNRHYATNYLLNTCVT